MIQVIGGGPAGASAAIAALAGGASVRIAERSRFPRHKVCGEFLSPEILVALGEIGMRRAFLEESPAVLRRIVLHVGRTCVTGRLPEEALGLSRYALDRLLLDAAIAAGGAVERSPADSPDATIIAHGRQFREPKGDRLFGYKAHFAGQLDDAIAVYFFPGGYVGVNAVEQGMLNVCGLASEGLLKANGFDFDTVVRIYAPLRERLEGSRRAMDWLATGPVAFPNRVAPARAGEYPAGDALAFVDPFTGSGVVSAITGGILAGRAAAFGVRPDEYTQSARRLLSRQLGVTRVFRYLLAKGWAEDLAPLARARWLFEWTRPRVRPALASMRAGPAAGF